MKDIIKNTIKSTCLCTVVSVLCVYSFISYRDKVEYEEHVAAEKEYTLRCLRAAQASSDVVKASESCAKMQYNVESIHYGVKTVRDSDVTAAQEEAIIRMFILRAAELQ